MSFPGSPHDRPPERYGGRPRPGRRRAGVIALAVLAGGLLAFVIWAAWHAATPDVRFGLLGFSVPGEDRVEVRFEVVADREATLRCDLRAENLRREIVGSTRVEVGPAAQSRRIVTAVVRTRERAVAAVVESCRRVPR
jgi:hypothetical protein